MHQIVNLRTGASPVQFIDAVQEREYHDRLAAARAAMPPGVRYVVAPEQRVQVRDGSWREPGEPIAAADVSDEPGAPSKGRVAWQVFASLLARETVIESYSWRPVDVQQHQR